MNSESKFESIKPYEKQFYYIGIGLILLVFFVVIGFFLNYFNRSMYFIGVYITIPIVILFILNVVGYWIINYREPIRIEITNGGISFDYLKSDTILIHWEKIKRIQIEPYKIIKHTATIVDEHGNENITTWTFPPASYELEKAFNAYKEGKLDEYLKSSVNKQ